MRFAHFIIDYQIILKNFMSMFFRKTYMYKSKSKHEEIDAFIKKLWFTTIIRIHYRNCNKKIVTISFSKFSQLFILILV